MLKEVFIKKEYDGWIKFWIVFSFCLLFILPLIFANVPYMDDATRMDNGNGHWEYEGRPLTTILLTLLNFNLNPIYNIGPIPLIIGTLFFSYSVCYATSKMDLKKNIVNILPFALLACNPYFIQNLSYQFDSIGNLFSIAFVLFSFFYANKNKTKTFIVQTLFLIGVYALYQPTSNMYLGLFLMNILFQFKKTNDQFLKTLIYHASVFLVAGILYTLLLHLSFAYIYPEVSYRSDTIKLDLQSLLFSYNYSISEFIDMNQSFKSETLMFFAKIAAIMYSFNILFLVIKTSLNKDYTTFNRTMVSFGLALSPILMFLSLWGGFIILKELFFNPRDFPIVGILFMMASMSFYFVNKNGYINLIFVGAILLGVCGFSFVYGSALKQDADYKRYVYDSISIKMEDHAKDIGDKPVNVYGRAGTSSFVRLAIVEHNFIYRLIYADNTNFFKKYNLGARGIKNINGGFVLDDLNEWNMICDSKIEPMVTNSNYDIFNFDGHVSIWFKRSKDFCDNYPLETDIHFSRKQDVYEATYGAENQ